MFDRETLIDKLFVIWFWSVTVAFFGFGFWAMLENKGEWETCKDACGHAVAKRELGGCWCTTDLEHWELRYKEVE